MTLSTLPSLPGHNTHEYNYFKHMYYSGIQLHKVVRTPSNSATGESILVATVYDLLLANYGVDNGLGDETCASSFDQDLPYMLTWQQQITGVKAADVIRVAREFARRRIKPAVVQ